MIAEFITYLQGAGLTPGVRFAFTTEPIEDYSDDLPVIMVYPQDYSASENGADVLVVQAVTVQIVCLLGCAVADYETLLDELRAKAIGWVAGGSWDAMELASASIVGLQGGYIWWQEVYSVRGQIRQVI